MIQNEHYYEIYGLGFFKKKKNPLKKITRAANKITEKAARPIVKAGQKAIGRPLAKVTPKFIRQPVEKIYRGAGRTVSGATQTVTKTAGVLVGTSSPKEVVQQLRRIGTGIAQVAQGIVQLPTKPITALFNNSKKNSGNTDGDASSAAEEHIETPATEAPDFESPEYGPYANMLDPAGNALQTKKIMWAAAALGSIALFVGLLWIVRRKRQAP